MADWLKPSHKALITGATGVIGSEIARGIASTGATLILAVRDVEKGKTLAAKLTEETGNSSISVESVDFDSLSSVQRLADSVAAAHGGTLHLLINCACTVPKTKQVTPDGVERQFATNVLGYFATMTAFRPLLQAGAAELAAAAAAADTADTAALPPRARIVNLASLFAGEINWADLEFAARPYDPSRTFKQSKALVRLLTGAAARKFAADGIDVNCCHPGIVSSPVLLGLGYRQGSQSPTAAAQTPLQLCLSPPSPGAASGRYFRDGRADATDAFCGDEGAGEKLWTACTSKLAAAAAAAAAGEGSA